MDAIRMELKAAAPRKANAFRIFHKLPFKMHSTKAPRSEKDKLETMPPHENLEMLKKYDPLADLDCLPSGLAEGCPNDDNDNKKRPENEFEEANIFVKHSVYISWLILLLFGYIREFMRSVGLESNAKVSKELDKQRSFAPLYNNFEGVYIRNCYMRVRDVFERPIGSCPGATKQMSKLSHLDVAQAVNVLDRYSDDYNWSFNYPGTQTKVINTGSYNYLGFAETKGPCSNSAAKAIDREGISTAASELVAIPSTQKRLESLVAEFLGVEESIVFPMGFATNALHGAAFADKDTFIVSDQYNHTSLRLGSRLSHATVKGFKHNDMKDLERILRDAIVYGNKKTCRPYKKIIIIVEGIYSMEGSICSLPEIIALKKKYKAYLYLDEAHSIGAMGKTGRGVVEYWNCDPKDVDVLMGTFTKSFGSSGGYIAGTKKLCSHIRAFSPSVFYAKSMSPPIAEQIISSMSIIMGKDGSNDGALRLERLHRNARYFRLKLKQMGFIIYGSDDSPVVPLLMYYPTHCGNYGRAMLDKKIAVCVVSFPATDMTESRVRFCLSAAHTKEMLDKVLQAVDAVGDNTYSKHSKRTHLYKDLNIEW